MVGRKPVILICTPSHSVAGGAERIIGDLVRGLPAHGFRVVLGLAWGAVHNIPTRFAEAFENAEWMPLDGRTGTAHGRRWAIRKALNVLSPDVVVNARLFDVLPAVGAAKTSGRRVRLVNLIFGCEAEYVLDNRSFRGVIDYCVTNGEATRAAVSEFAGCSDRAVNIPGGVRRAWRPVEVGGPQEPLRIAYVGRLAQDTKRILDLPPVLSRLRDAGVSFRCEVVGAGPDAETLRREVVAAGLESNVKFVGWCSEEELFADIYPNVDVMLSFSESEGVPIAPREAMAHGSALVMAEYRGCRREGLFVAGENCLLFPPGDADGAAGLVRSLADDRALLRKLGRGAMASIVGVYEAEGAMEAWAKLLNRALALEGRRDLAPDCRQDPVAGRLDRLVGRSAAEWVRRVMHRYPRAAEGGAEWPHWSGAYSVEALETVVRFAMGGDEELTSAFAGWIRTEKA